MTKPSAQHSWVTLAPFAVPSEMQCKTSHIPEALRNDATYKINITEDNARLVERPWTGMIDCNLVDEYNSQPFISLVTVPGDSFIVLMQSRSGHLTMTPYWCLPSATGVSRSAASCPRTNSRQKSMCDAGIFLNAVFVSAFACLSSDASSTDYCPRPPETGRQESDLVNSIHLRKMNAKSVCQGTVLDIRVRTRLVLHRQLNSSPPQGRAPDCDQMVAFCA